jgi:hypothetical protein
MQERDSADVSGGSAPAATSARRRVLAGLLAAAAGALLYSTVWDLVRRHGGLAPRFGASRTALSADEMTLIACMTMIGIPAIIFWAWGMARAFGDPLSRPALRAWIDRRALLLAASIAALTVLWTASIRHHVFYDWAWTDDEYCYQFMADTFRSGQITRLVPPEEYRPFFQDQFNYGWNRLAVTHDGRWFAIYPPGNAAVIALGQAFGLGNWIIPLCAGATALLVFFIVRRISGPGTALLAQVLLAASPLFYFLGATTLSQTVDMLFLSLFIWTFMRAFDAGRPSAAFAAPAGLALGAAFLTRDLPAPCIGLTFAAAAVIWTLRGRAPRRWARLALFAGGLLVAAAAWLANNRAVTGEAFVTPRMLSLRMTAIGSGGAGASIGSLIIDQPIDARLESLGRAFVRMNFWAFGIPLSLLPLLFLRRTRWTALFGAAAAVYAAAHFLLPHQGLFIAGNIYFADILVLLAPLAALGAAAAAQRFEAGRGRVFWAVCGGLLGGLLILFPLHARSIQNVERTIAAPYRALDAVVPMPGDGKDLHFVFMDMASVTRPAFLNNSPPYEHEVNFWPMPKPDFSDRFLFVERKTGGTKMQGDFRDAALAMLRLHPERSVYQVALMPGGSVRIDRLDEDLRTVDTRFVTREELFGGEDD